MFKDYLLQNWALILILLAFTVSLKMTVSLDRKIIRRMFVLIIGIFLLSITVFAEFNMVDPVSRKGLRTVLVAIRYSATPFILAQVLYTLIKKMRWFVFVPAIILAVFNCISVFTGIVYTVNDDGTIHRGLLGLWPFIMVGLYCTAAIRILYRRSNKQTEEIIPLVFLCFAFGLGLLFPFVLGNDYSQIFCVTIAIALFTYYVFSILQLTRKDSLTGLLNRQAFFADLNNNPEDITALVSIDMNGLKEINDTGGHAAGDEALSTLAICFMRALRRGQSGYRIGGDEFVIVCRRSSREETDQLVERIRHFIAETAYSCSIGYSFAEEESREVDDLLRKSDAMMYAEKAQYYESEGKDRRKR